MLAVLLTTGMLAAVGFGTVSEATEVDLIIPETAASPIEENGIRLVIDGQQVSFSESDGLGVPFIYNGRTMVPLRKPFEAIGASVGYDAAGRTATIDKDDTEISAVADGEIFVNGNEFSQTVAPIAPAMIKDGRMYVPVKHIFEALGYSVSWDQAARTVNIKKTGVPIKAAEGWSFPGPSSGVTGLGAVGDVEVLTGFRWYDKMVRLNDNEQIQKLNSPEIGIRNFFQDKAVVIDPITLEYQIYKKGNGKEELVFRKLFPPFEGTLPALSATFAGLQVDFWNPNTTAPGEYTIKLAHPEFLTGTIKESTEPLKIPLSGDAFTEAVTITVSK